MTTISIMPESADAKGVAYRAVAGELQSVGKTVGEALDALTAQLSEEEAGTLIIVQNLCPDAFFSAQQMSRLSELMERRGEATDEGSALTTEERAELETLVKAELRAATKRAEAMANKLGV